MITFLDFEKPIAELEGKIRELRRLSDNEDVNITEEVGKLETKLNQLTRQTYRKLTPWQKTLVARHPDRPHFKDYIERLIEGFTPLAGDRYFGEDHAIVGGLGRFRGRSVLVIGHEKGSDTQSRIHHNFGMARPEGYRKAVRLMKLADRFHIPVITVVDTPGAYPGVGAEERGQAEAIARSTQTCLEIGVPLVTVIVGEGGSGGAIALASANKVLMMEHAIYSVISPEGCASILWRSADKAQEAAEALRITAEDLDTLGIIDGIVPEPVGGAHRDPRRAIDEVGAALETTLAEISDLGADELRTMRREKFLDMGNAGLS